MGAARVLFERALELNPNLRAGSFADCDDAKRCRRLLGLHGGVTARQRLRRSLPIFHLSFSPLVGAMSPYVPTGQVSGTKGRLIQVISNFK